MEPKTKKKWKCEKIESKKNGYANKSTVWGICGVSLKKKRKAMVGRICRKGRFLGWNERVRR